MITENILINLGFKKQSRKSYDPSFQSHGEVYTKHGLTIDGWQGSDGFNCSDLSGQTKFENLKQLDNYFIGCGKPAASKV